MNEAARNKMTAARSRLVLDHPFFASLALRLELREDANCATAWSDGKVLAYNPRYIEAVSLERVAGLQCHEVLHLACCHHTRRGERDPKRWNAACDYAINPILLEAGVKLPTGFLDDPDHYGKSAETIYHDLYSGLDETHGGGEGGHEQETAADQEVEAESGQADGLEGDEQPESNNSDGQDGAEQQRDAAGDEDNDGDGDPQENTDPGMSGEVRDASPGDQGPDGGESLRLEEESWQMSLAQALHKARECGHLPGSLERLLSRELFPCLGWRDILRRFLQNAAKNDFSWVRPNRRRLHTGFYLPGLENLELPRMAVAVDVSGSITQPELSGFAAELSAVLEEFDSGLTVFTCDAFLTSREELSRHDLPLDFTAKGGGGTSFRPPFEALEEDGIAPACMVYFTDLACNVFPEDPGYPVLWVTPNPDHEPPPFGEVVLMENSL